MNRRIFLGRSLATVGTLALASSIPLSLTGCAVDVKGLVNTVIASVEGILRVAAPNAPWATELSAALAVLQQAEAQWTAGGAVTLVEDALNTIVAVVAVVPLTAPYAPLVAILVAGIEAVLNALVPTTGAAAPAARRPNVYSGRVGLQKPHVFETQVGAYRKQWNAQAKMLGLTQAVIQ